MAWFLSNIHHDVFDRITRTRVWISSIDVVELFFVEWKIIIFYLISILGDVTIILNTRWRAHKGPVRKDARHCLRTLKSWTRESASPYGNALERVAKSHWPFSDFPFQIHNRKTWTRPVPSWPARRTPSRSNWIWSIWTAARTTKSLRPSRRTPTTISSYNCRT